MKEAAAQRLSQGGGLFIPKKGRFAGSYFRLAVIQTMSAVLRRLHSDIFEKRAAEGTLGSPSRRNGDVLDALASGSEQVFCGGETSVNHILVRGASGLAAEDAAEVIGAYGSLV